LLNKILEGKDSKRKWRKRKKWRKWRKRKKWRKWRNDRNKETSD
jgi:hypothetical protein